MTEVSIGIRYNENAEEVEVYAVSGETEEVIGSSGKDYFKSWVESYNEKHPETKVIIEEVRPAEVVAPPAEATTPVEPAAEEAVDKAE